MSVVSAIRRPLHTFVLTQSLSLRQHARADARQDPPGPGAQLSPTEANLLARYHHAVTRLDTQRSQALKTERVGAITLELEEHDVSCAQTVKATTDRMWQDWLKFRTAWNEARAVRQARVKDKEDFKREHRLNREPHLPDLFLTVVLLLCAFIGDTAANATLFANVLPHAWLDAAILCSVLTLPNIVLGLLHGFSGRRRREHIQAGVRALGTIIVLITVAAAASWWFYIGHLRTIAEQVAGQAYTLQLTDWSLVTRQMLGDPSAVLASPHALVLMLAAIAVFLLAAYKGFSGLTDSYPGYGRHGALIRAADRTVQALKWRFFDTLQAHARAGRKAVRAELAVSKKKARQAVRILAGAHEICLAFAHRFHELLAAYQAATAIYRATNRACRGETNIPARFNDPCPDPKALPAYDWQGMRDRIKTLLRKAQEAAKAAEDEIDAYRRHLMRDIERQDGNPTPEPPAHLTRIPVLHAAPHPAGSQ